VYLYFRPSQQQKTTKKLLYLSRSLTYRTAANDWTASDVQHRGPPESSDPQQTPVHRVEQDERRGEDDSALLVDPNRNLLGRGRQPAVQLARRLLGHLKLHLAHRFHFHRVGQLGVQFRMGALIKNVSAVVRSIGR